MSDYNTNSTSDFLITFFIGRHKKSRLLSEIIEHKDDPIYLKELGIPEDFQIPFTQEKIDGNIIYSLKSNEDSNYFGYFYDERCFDHIINDSDFIVFKNPRNNKTFSALFVNTSNIDPNYGKYKLYKNQSIYVGRSANNDIVFNLNNLVSREKQFVIQIDDRGTATVKDLKRSLGVYVNGEQVTIKKLEPFDEIYFMGLSIVYLGSKIAVNNYKVNLSLQPSFQFNYKQPIPKKKQPTFVRSPRILKSIENNELEIDAPPSPKVQDKTPAILVIGPSVTMALVMLLSLSLMISNSLSGGNIATAISSGIMAVGMFISALLWPLLLRNYQKKEVNEENAFRRERYQAYINDIERDIRSSISKTKSLLNNTLVPSPASLLSFLDSESNKLRLWEKSYQDNDFLNVRVGKGERPSNVIIKTPKLRFDLVDDELRLIPQEVQQEYSTIKDVPITLNLFDNKAIGLIGESNRIHNILEEIILNIMTLNSFDEVKLVFVANQKQKEMFKGFMDIPHVWSNDKQTRYFATDHNEVHHLFNQLDQIISEREEANLDESKVVPLPYFVFIITDPDLIEKEGLTRYLNNAQNKVGVTTIFAYGDITQIPKSCETIIQSDNHRTGYYIKNQNENKFIEFSLDQIDSRKVDNFAKKLVQLPIKRDVRTLGIPENVTFLQLYKVGNIEDLRIEENWDNNNSSKSLAVPIGISAGGEIFSLDLHESYHGCHGLVAGTTGSGKSEFLQEFILSLAVNYSPKEVAFVLVDFKGGDMARPFMNKQNSPALPHLAATISNLTESILYRAMVSFEAEIKNRQRLFNEAAKKLGVDKLDINSYHKYYKAGKLDVPLPHLVIIIDEFAQLKSQHYEFLTQLINVAQVGRSLGIHLILATQKPSGQVDPQIWSNSRFKVCLRVTDKQDSMDMLNKPDAALIKNPGRMYLQVGYDEIYECIQSGYSGADYEPSERFTPDEDVTIQLTDNTAFPLYSARLNYSDQSLNKTQLEAVVNELIKIGQKRDEFVKPLWLDDLPEKLYLEDISKSKKKSLTTTFGLIDLIKSQEQIPLSLDLTETGHIGIYGTSGTGKTTLLQTLIFSLVSDYEYTPDDLNIYALDFGGRNLGYLNNLPHTGGVVFEEEQEKIDKLLQFLNAEIERRKQLFSRQNVGTFNDYKVVSNEKLPAIVVLIDNYSSLHEKYMEFSDRLVNIVSSGQTYGIYFIITGNTRNAIYYRVSEHISTYLTLRLNDEAYYFDILGVRPPVFPGVINGRGLTVLNKEVVEFQTALAYKSENEAERISLITDRYKALNKQWTGNKVASIENIDDVSSVVPDVSITDEESSSIPDLENDESNFIVLSDSNHKNYGYNLEEDYKVSVVTDGKVSMGNTLRKLLEEIDKYDDREFIFIDDANREFEGIVSKFTSGEYVWNEEGLNTVIEKLSPELNDRLSNASDEFSKKFIIISDFNNFFDMITDEQAEFFRKLVRYLNLPQYGIHFITGFNANKKINNDVLFMRLLENSNNYVIGPNSYNKAASKLSNLPNSVMLNPNSYYFVRGNDYKEIR